MCNLGQTSPSIRLILLPTVRIHAHLLRNWELFEQMEHIIVHIITIIIIIICSSGSTALNYFCNFFFVRNRHKFKHRHKHKRWLLYLQYFHVLESLLLPIPDNEPSNVKPYCGLERREEDPKFERGSTLYFCSELDGGISDMKTNIKLPLNKYEI